MSSLLTVCRRLALRPCGALKLVALAAAASALGCAPATTLRGGYCAPPSAVALPLAEDPPPSPSAPRIEHLAALLGVRAILEKPPASRAVEERQRALERIVLAHLAIAAVTAELACEAERAEHAAAFVAREKSAQVQGLTLGSIGAATLTGIAGVALSTSNASKATQVGVGAGGAGVTAGLGVASLYVAPTIEFEHPRNLLTDVWRGPVISAAYAPVVWAYLTRPVFSNDQHDAIRARIVARWMRVQKLDTSPEAAALLFGGGGKYDSETLHARAVMLDAVSAEVELENQDLAALTAELTR